MTQDNPLTSANSRSSGDTSTSAAGPGAGTGAGVTVSGVSKAFGENQVLRDVNFTVPSGSVTVIIGPSGSGKTTLLRSLNALDVPDTGKVTIGEVSVDFDQRLSTAQVARYRAQSGMVFQAHNLFPHKTVLENVTEGPVVVQRRDKAAARADAESILASLGLTERQDFYPHELSGGQQQRVGIARALALHPQVLLFDEPTSALDPELVGEVLAVIKKLSDEGWTLVIVTHEIRFARAVADQVIYFSGGEVVEIGPPAEVLENPQSSRTRKFLAAVHY